MRPGSSGTWHARRMTFMSAAGIADFMLHTYPQARPDRFRIESVTDEALTLRYSTTQDDLRPGATVSGPTLMTLSDVGMYYALLAGVGPDALAATTSMTIHFLNRAAAGELVVEAKL